MKLAKHLTEIIFVMAIFAVGLAAITIKELFFEEKPKKEITKEAGYGWWHL